MTLRAWFISRIGSRAGDPILDKEIILGWFTAEQKLSLAEAKERAARWKNTRLPINDRLPLNEVRELRGIKNRLRIIKTLQECGELPQDSYLNEWLEIRRSLP